MDYGNAIDPDLSPGEHFTIIRVRLAETEDETRAPSSRPLLPVATHLIGKRIRNAGGLAFPLRLAQPNGGFAYLTRIDRIHCTVANSGQSAIGPKAAIARSLNRTTAMGR